MAFFTAATDPHLFHCPCDRKACDAPPPTDAFLQQLNLMRAFYQRPIRVTSGPRCAVHNQRVGGEAHSAHLLGTAADLYCPTTPARWLMLEAARHADFRRLGIGKDFLHVDVAKDTSHPQDVVWTYYPRAS